MWQVCAVPDNTLQRSGELMINAGVMVIRPSSEHFADLLRGMARAAATAAARAKAANRTQQPGLPEQEFLSEYYNVSRLDFAGFTDFTDFTDFAHRRFSTASLPASHRSSRPRFQWVSDLYNSCSPRYFWTQALLPNGSFGWTPCCHDAGCDGTTPPHMCQLTYSLPSAPRPNGYPASALLCLSRGGLSRPQSYDSTRSSTNSLLADSYDSYCRCDYQSAS
jgi:hypothetical protein